MSKNKIYKYRTYARVLRNRVFDENLSFGPADSAKNPVSLARCVTPEIFDAAKNLLHASA
ncbi:hypothetical protein [Microcoleus sp. bin38.metabat.b11b12b14.051]|uniref:hypothetical protein n=1 Tax=Microcoleus sp. bin38.metabat.b11b12b14.051 TaxID=2742709 RepID=UPI0025F67AF2|nr:hypothetical protein [Microcoleus sp. bin38.metabat.b11b12b14.051]